MEQGHRCEFIFNIDYVDYDDGFYGDVDGDVNGDVYFSPKFWDKGKGGHLQSKKCHYKFS